MMKATVVAALPGEQRVVELELADGATVWDAVIASGLLPLYAGIETAELAVGVWSRACARETPVRAGDRVEIYRPIRADAKAMRRARARVSPSRRSRSGP
jgi:putative ubiquitin-RnfH superfamily antitoxin RatB of RatAB toxin-antitoxin module